MTVTCDTRGYGDIIGDRNFLCVSIDVTKNCVLRSVLKPEVNKFQVILCQLVYLSTINFLKTLVQDIKRDVLTSALEHLVVTALNCTDKRVVYNILGERLK